MTTFAVPSRMSGKALAKHALSAEDARKQQLSDHLVRRVNVAVARAGKITASCNRHSDFHHRRGSCVSLGDRFMLKYAASKLTVADLLAMVPSTPGYNVVIDIQTSLYGCVTVTPVLVASAVVEID